MGSSVFLRRGATPEESNDAIRELQRALGAADILSGRLVTVSGTGPGAVNVAHGMMRKPVGWVVSRQRGAIVGHPREVADPDDRFLYLTVGETGAYNFDLWVW